MLKTFRLSFCLMIVTFVMQEAGFGDAISRRKSSSRSLQQGTRSRPLPARRITSNGPFVFGEGKFAPGIISIGSRGERRASSSRSTASGGFHISNKKKKKLRKRKQRERKRLLSLKRNLQLTERVNSSSFLNPQPFGIPTLSGDQKIIFPLPIITKDSKFRNVITFDSSDVRAADLNARLRLAEIYIQFLVDNRRDVTILPSLVRVSNRRTVVVAKAKQWSEEPLSNHHNGANRSGRLRSTAHVKRFVFVVTRLGITSRRRGNDFTANLTEEPEDNLPRLSSWKVPKLQLSILCRRKWSIVPCARNGVTVYGLPYLVLTTASSSSSRRGIRMR